MYALQISMSLTMNWTASAQADQWYIINDTVMGGVSQSTVAPHPEGGLIFSGFLSLENNGGFVSTRTDALSMDWSTTSTLQFRVVGDGRSYIATLRPRSTNRRLYYRQRFATVAGREINVTLPLEDFEAYTFGRKVPTAPPLIDLKAEIKSVGLMLADNRQGPFALRLREISAFEKKSHDAQSQGQPAPSIKVALTRAVEKGVPLFNAGRADRCADIYAATITTLLVASSTQLSALHRNRLEKALRDAEDQESQEDRAWILRHGIDAVARDLP